MSIRDVGPTLGEVWMPPTGVDWSAIPWDDVIPRLLLFAHQRVRRLSFSGITVSPQDLVQDAIEKTLSGTRIWKPAERSLIDHLAGVISSSLFNNVRKVFAQAEIPLDVAILESAKSNAPSPEDNASYKSEIAALLSFVQSKNPELAEMVSAILLFGADTSRDLAQILNAPIDVVYANQRRLRRIVNEYSLMRRNLVTPEATAENRKPVRI